MKLFYVSNTEDWSDRWEPEFCHWEHFIYAHDEEAARALFERKHYGYLVGPWVVEKVDDAPHRKRQGFAGKKANEDLCWQRFLSREGSRE
jgi:hypothetical protein